LWAAGPVLTHYSYRGTGWRLPDKSLSQSLAAETLRNC